MNKVGKVPVSVVITAYNEENKLPGCLESVEWADEIIVVNSSSDDRTVEVAKKYSARVFTQPNHLMLNTNKNYGFGKAKNEWILSLDADERITPRLAEEIASIVNSPDENHNGFNIARKNVIFGKWIQNSIWWPDYQLRLFRKGKGKFPEKHVHEMVRVEGETGILEYPMEHYNYESISQYIYKMDRIYTENEAANILNSDKQLYWYDAIRMPVGDFLKTFFLQKGYKDGLHGLVLSFLQAFYSEIVFAKVWEKRGFTEHNSDDFIHDVIWELRKTASEFHYWILSVLIDDAKKASKKLYYRLLRKRVQKQLSSK